jgi:gliding motility-associated-like protein
LVPNGDFETAASAPGFGEDDFAGSNVSWWNVAQFDGDNCDDFHAAGQHPCGSADYVDAPHEADYLSSNSCPSPAVPSNRFAGLQSGSVQMIAGFCHHSQGIRVQLIKDGNPYSLVKGHTYKLKLKLRLGSGTSSNLHDNLRVHFAYFGENWNANPATSVNRRWLDATSFVYDPASYDPCTWYDFERTFVVPESACDGGGGCDFLQNMILFLDDNDSEEISAGLYIDNVELYDEGCCIPFKQYENTSDLPPLTQTSDYIRAGFDAGIASTSGDVTVLSGQNVTFKAGNQIILEPGFIVQSGATYTGIIEDCNSSSMSSGPISVPFVPNVFTPNGDGVNDNYCLNVTGANQYHIQVFDRWGVLIFDYMDFIYSSFVCMWDGRCNQGPPNCTSSGIVGSDTYFFVIDLFNCSNSTQISGSTEIFKSMVTLDDPTGTETPATIMSIIPNPNNGTFQIMLNKDDRSTPIKEIKVLDIMGQVVWQTSSPSATMYDVDIANYSSGIYYAKCISESGVVEVKKLIKY